MFRRPIRSSAAWEGRGRRTLGAPGGGARLLGAPRTRGDRARVARNPVAAGALLAASGARLEALLQPGLVLGDLPACLTPGHRGDELADALADQVELERDAGPRTVVQ